MHCQRECIEAKDFICRSFNYRDTTSLFESSRTNSDNSGREVTNCELSDRDTRELDLQNPMMFDTGSFDYYERSNSRSGGDPDCLDGKKKKKYIEKYAKYKNEFIDVIIKNVLIFFSQCLSITNMQRRWNGIHTENA